MIGYKKHSGGFIRGPPSGVFKIPLFNYSSNMSNLSFTSKKINLPVFYLCLRYIEVQMYLAICYPTCFCVAITLQPFSCLNSYSFTPSYHYMHTNLPCTEITSRNAKISTLDPNNFFWLRSFIPNLTKILI